MQNAKLEVCTKNARLGSRNVAVRVAERVASERRQADIRQWACLGPCEHCARRPFLLVNDASYVIADNADALYERVCQLLSRD